MFWRRTRTQKMGEWRDGVQRIVLAQLQRVLIRPPGAVVVDVGEPLKLGRDVGEALKLARRQQTVRHSAKLLAFN